MGADGLDCLARELRSLLPLDEPNVDRFVELAVAIADLGTTEAAAVLFGALDDRCTLGGVMQTISGLLQEFPPEPLLAALIGSVSRTSADAPHGVEDVLRGVVLSPEHRALLRSRLPTISSGDRLAIEAHLRSIGRAHTYAQSCSDILDG